MSDTPEIAVGDLVEVLFAYLGPGGEPEPGRARRRWRGHAVEVGERLVLQVLDGDAPAGSGTYVMPQAQPGFVSVRVLQQEIVGFRNQHPVGPAPAQMVHLVHGVAPRPMHPTGEPTVGQWQAQLQLVADKIWAEAWHAGAVWGQSIAAVPGMLVVTPEERDRMVRDFGAGAV